MNSASRLARMGHIHLLCKKLYIVCTKLHDVQNSLHKIELQFTVSLWLDILLTLLIQVVHVYLNAVAIVFD